VGKATVVYYAVVSNVQAPPDPAAAVDQRGTSVGRPLVFVLAGLCLVILGILLWSFFGRAPQTVSGLGYVVPVGGYTEVGTRVDGLVASVGVEPGQRVRLGEELVRVYTEESSGTLESILSPVDGTVIEVVAMLGRITEPGDPMVYLHPLGSPLLVKGFVPTTEIETIRVGMPALVSPADAPRSAQYGAILGTVTALTPTPVTADRVGFIVGNNSALVDYFLGAGPVIEATVELKLDSSTPSGYAWSIGQGPDIEIRAGTLSQVTLVVRDAPVASWFMR